MALSPNITLTHPIQIGLTAGSDSGVAILIGSGSPDGNADPFASAGKSSIFFSINQTDDQPAMYQKVDNDGADDDWVQFLLNKTEGPTTFENHVTLDVDKRIYFRDTDTSIYSDSACKLYVSAASGMDIEKVSVGSGTFIDSIIAGSGTIAFGALVAGATSTACLAITNLTQEHKIFVSPSSMSACLNLNAVSCSPGGGLLSMTVGNTASEAATAGDVIFGYMALAACG